MTLLSAIGISLYIQMSLENLRDDCEDSIHLFLNTSDYLTNEVFNFYDTKKVEHLNNYWEEVSVKKTRIFAEKNIKFHNLSAKEIKSLNQAIHISNSLSNIECHAMRLIVKTSNLQKEDLPEELASYKLPLAETKLSNSEKIEIA